MKKTIFSLLVILAASAVGYAYQAGRGGDGQRTSRQDGLDPTPIDPTKDPNVEMFLNDYRNAKPRPMYGKLISATFSPNSREQILSIRQRRAQF